MEDDVTYRPVGRIDQYELVSELGGGGFGCVYLARDTVAGVAVAVKGLPPEVRHSKEELENIRENFALVSRLHHPNIAAALVLHPVRKTFYATKDAMEKLRVFEGDTLLVMEYASGETLSSWRKQFPEKKVPVEKALEIVRQVAAALDYAHERRIIHRDVKPANVMVETEANGKLGVRVLDFGLAAEIRSSMGRVSRGVCDTSGTRRYMAPEQWAGERQGVATDQYALAAMFCELVTGETPFAGVFETGNTELMRQVVRNDEPKLPAELARHVRTALSKALSKRGDERFESCAAFVDALEGKGADEGTRDGKAGLVVVGALVALVALAGGLWCGRRTSAPLSQPAPEEKPLTVVSNAAPATSKPAAVAVVSNAAPASSKPTAVAVEVIAKPGRDGVPSPSAAGGGTPALPFPRGFAIASVVSNAAPATSKPAAVVSQNVHVGATQPVVVVAGTVVVAPVTTAVAVAPQPTTSSVLQSEEKYPLSKAFATGKQPYGTDYGKEFHRCFRLAAKGDADAQFCVGWMYLKGLGVGASAVQARKYFKKSATKGNSYAVQALEAMGE